MGKKLEEKTTQLLNDDDIVVPDLLKDDDDIPEEIVDDELLEFEALVSSAEKTIELKDIKSTKDWQKYITQVDVSQAKKYSIHDKFEKGDLISHDKFGLGIVCKILTSKKMEVFFEDGRKLMAMNYPLG